MSTVLVSEWLVGFKADNTRSTLNGNARSCKITTPSRCVHGDNLLSVLHQARLRGRWSKNSAVAVLPTQSLPGVGISTAGRAHAPLLAFKGCEEGSTSGQDVLAQHCHWLRLTWQAGVQGARLLQWKGTALEHGIPPTVTAFSLSAPSDGGGLSRIILRI